MNEFMELTNPKELPEEMTDCGVSAAMLEINQLHDMNEEDASWIEKLFQRMVEPLVDLLEGDRPGYDTERIVPRDTATPAEIRAEYELDEATAEWHVQAGDNSCAVCSQQFIINEFLDLDLSEEQLCTIAEASGWFDPEGGTTLEDADNLLELFGIDSRMDYNAGYEDLKKTLDDGGRAIVAVDSMVLWVDGAGNYPVYGADHAIEVVGIDDSNPNDVKVIINDSGSPDGCGRAVPLNEFMEAWQPSGGYMVSAYPKD